MESYYVDSVKSLMNNNPKCNNYSSNNKFSFCIAVD